MSKTVVERRSVGRGRAVVMAIERQNGRMGMGEDGRQVRRTGQQAAARPSVSKSEREGNTSCVKQVARLLQLDERGRSEIARRGE